MSQADRTASHSHDDATQGLAARRWTRVIVSGLTLVVLIGSVSFANFTNSVKQLTAPQEVEADGMVVVTGGASRIEVALQLLQQGAAKRLLISGVFDGTNAQSLASRTRADPALFDCCIDLDHAAMDTVGNARETARWAKDHQFGSLLVVTSAYHIPRTTREIQRQLPDVELIAFPIDPTTDTQRASAEPSHAWPLPLMLREFMKLQLANMRHLVADIMPASS